MPARGGYQRLYATQRWRRLSRLALARSGGRCEMTPGCPRPATTADHIVPALELAAAGRLEDLFFSISNVRAACGPCNASAGARLGNQRRGQRRVTAMEAAERAAIAWAERENAYWRRVEAERQAVAAARPEPRIY